MSVATRRRFCDFCLTDVSTKGATHVSRVLRTGWPLPHSLSATRESVKSRNHCPTAARPMREENYPVVARMMIFNGD